MKKSRMWTLAMALAAALGGTMDPEFGDSVSTQGRNEPGLDAGGHPDGKDGREPLKDADRRPTGGNNLPA